MAARNSRAASSGSLTVDELVPKNIWTSPLDAFVTRATTGSVMLGTALVDGRRSFRGYGRRLVVEEGTDSRKGGGDAGRRHGQRPPLQELTAIELSHQISSSVCPEFDVTYMCRALTSEPDRDSERLPARMSRIDKRRGRRD